LIGASLLLPYSAVKGKFNIPGHPRVLLPEQLEFVSYPFEWSFSQLKDAALATLEIQAIAMEHGMSLKDATPFNMQLWKGRPCLIDSLSLEIQAEGSPWKAYRQFCETFLAPLLWASRVDAEVLSAQSAFLEGIPLGLASRLLPWTNWTALFHVHLHGRASGYSNHWELNESRISVSKKSVLAVVESLRSGIGSLSLRRGKSEWSGYYESCNYSEQAFESKKAIIEGWRDRIQPQSAWDLGANTGEFSRLLGRRGASVLSVDIDPICVDALYRSRRNEEKSCIHAIRADLANPPPGVGWNNAERPSLFDRGGRRDVVLALALVHHLCLGKNISWEQLARLFQRLGRWVMVEFVPKEDPRSKRLLRTRTDLFPFYSEHEFLQAMGRFFAVRDSRPVKGTGRTLHLLESHE